MPVLEIPLERTHPDRHEWCRGILASFGVVGAGCSVAVIDKGVDPEWLAAQDLVGPRDVVPLDFTRGQEGPREPPGDQPGERHGSRIIADILRSAPLARVHSLRVHGAEHEADRADIVRALEWCGRNGITVANLSVAFYDRSCTDDSPCVLCRSINSIALASGLFTVISSGDAVTIGEKIDRGDEPWQCPTARAQLGWGIASPEVVTPAKILLEHPEGGLSFTTGKFSAGVAQLRGALPGVDLFAIRRAIRRSCVPSAHVPQNIGGFGRHCFLLAWLAATGLAEIPAEAPSAIEIKLGGPSERTANGVDKGLLRAARLVSAALILRQQWQRAKEATLSLLRAAAPWASEMDQALLQHLLGSCAEATGDDAEAASAYDEAAKRFQSAVGATAALPGTPQ